MTMRDIARAAPLILAGLLVGVVMAKGALEIANEIPGLRSIAELIGGAGYIGGLLLFFAAIRD